MPSGSLALYLYLLRKGKTVDVIIPDIYPEFSGMASACRDIRIFESSKEECVRLVRSADTVSVSILISGRLNELGREIANSEVPKILIDHQFISIRGI